MNLQKLEASSLRLNQRVLFISSEWIVKSINEDGSIVLASTSKNLPDKLIRAKDVKYCFQSKDVNPKKVRFAV